VVLPTIFGILVISFILSRAIPSDPAAVIAGDLATPETVSALRAEMGLDKPALEQFLDYCYSILQGDFGISLFSGNPVGQDIWTYFMATLELANSALLVALIVGIFSGVLAAQQEGKLFDGLSRVLAILFASMPVFWFGLILVYVFYVQLGWFPNGGRIDLSITPPPEVTRSLIFDSILDSNLPALRSALHHLFLPTMTLGLIASGPIARVTRASMKEVLNEEYIRSVRSRGFSTKRIFLVHALRNAIIPPITLAGLVYGALLGGAVLTETIFSWPGLGRYAVQSMFRVDLNAMMGVIIATSLAFIIVNIVVDATYHIINPLTRE
jgi:peptide/nickel transport system permease protein